MSLEGPSQEVGRPVCPIPPAPVQRPTTVSRPRVSLAALPNMITLARICLVPLVLAAIAGRLWIPAFAMFLVAGLSDALDGFLARRFDVRSTLGAYLDPIADKALLMSIYVGLALSGALPATVAILVVSRDVMILGAVVVSWLLDKPVEIKPLFVSKANTSVQIVFAAAVLGALAFGLDLGRWFGVSLAFVVVLTLASAGAYLIQWSRHMSE